LGIEVHVVGAVPLPALNDWDPGVPEGVGDFVGTVEREAGGMVDTFAVFFEKAPVDTITVERLDDLEVETVYRRIADLERGVRGFAVVLRVRLIRWTDIVDLPRFDTENESVPFHGIFEVFDHYGDLTDLGNLDSNVRNVHTVAQESRVKNP